jgi:hypothetical protein
MKKSAPLSSAPAPKGKKLSQERIMVMLSVVFFGGVLLFTITPEGPIRGLLTGFYSLGVMWWMLKIK